MAKLTVKIEPEDIAERVIDGFKYKGKTIREWADMLTNPKTNGDWLRALPDEELANQLCNHACALCPITPCEGRMEIGREACYKRWLNYLQSPIDKENNYDT